mmetsp:Transcript_15356/g.33750  ORF Transcript_15356/g.33750 Transcript_15356/m.33750 type:complete len:98 (+) Transcript_15356:220-513(+)
MVSQGSSSGRGPHEFLVRSSAGFQAARPPGSRPESSTLEPETALPSLKSSKNSEFRNPQLRTQGSALSSLQRLANSGFQARQHTAALRARMSLDLIS